MHNWSKSKVPAVAVACGFLFAGLLSGPPRMRSAQIATLAGQDGGNVYINASPSNLQSQSTQSEPVATGPARIDSIIDRVSSHYQVDPKLVHAMIRVESNYDPSAVSSKGAMGLMQLIPATAHRFGVRNPFDPGQNIQGGVSYLKYLLHLFGGNLPLSLAAYNAGEQRVIQSGGVPAIPETEHYVRAITHLYHSKNAGSAATEATAAARIVPIVRYVDSQGVIHFTNAD
ncbi:MAG TPA: lytic transglycosylase domain-containing protein [Terriglobia bacterium]|nr:lytic transglycosylase domain-containing protein [Terriglobia bacterium]